jgi:hypothetical protein
MEKPHNGMIFVIPVEKKSSPLKTIGLVVIGLFCFISFCVAAFGVKTNPAADNSGPQSQPAPIARPARVEETEEQKRERIEKAEADERARQLAWDQKNAGKIADMERAAADKKKNEEAQTRELEAKAKAKEEKAAADKIQLEKLEKIIQESFDSGFIKKTRSCKFWVNPLTWRLMNRDAKEQVIRGLAAYIDLRDGKGPVCAVLSYQDDSVLGETNWTGGVTINK